MIHRQIEKLQKTVDHLLGSCFSGKTKAMSDDADRPRPNSKHERLGVMLLKAQDGVLEERYLRRMEKWLLCDKVAMQYYIDFQSLTALLTMHFNPERFSPESLRQQTLATQ